MNMKLPSCFLLNLELRKLGDEEDEVFYEKNEEQGDGEEEEISANKREVNKKLQ